MIRAGQLKCRLIIEAPIEKKSEFGSISKEYKEIFTCRAYRKKQLLSNREEENAYEEFVFQTIVMQTRNYPQIQYGCRVRYECCVWDIKMIERTGNKMTLTLKKIDV